MDLIGFYDIKEIKPDSQRLDRMFCLIWRNYILKKNTRKEKTKRLLGEDQ